MALCCSSTPSALVHLRQLQTVLHACQRERVCAVEAVKPYAQTPPYRLGLTLIWENDAALMTSISMNTIAQ